MLNGMKFPVFFWPLKKDLIYSVMSGLDIAYIILQGNVDMDQSESKRKPKSGKKIKLLRFFWGLFPWLIVILILAFVFNMLGKIKEEKALH